jgi:hypothetical protein
MYDRLAPIPSAGIETGQIGKEEMTTKTMMSAVRSAVLVAFALVVMTGAMRAQEFRGTISGAVTDPTGAVVPGASVTVRETRTGTVNQTTSDADGQYVVPFLLPGEYEVTVTAKGFQTVLRKSITLQSQEHPIVSVALPLGNTTDTVNVTTDVPLVDQSNASVGQVISTESVEDMPINGRTPTTLTELSVGVISNNAPQLVHPFDNNAGNSWSIGGTPKQVSEVLLDGAPDLTLLGATAYSPTQDSVQEVSIRPFDTDASFGHTIGGVVNQVTKSGGNGLHGTAYEFYQTAGLDANLWFNKAKIPAAVRPNAHFHQFGGTLGGPVIIPKLYNGKDKLFFFVAFERERDLTPLNQSLTVPTAAERSGDFSALLTAACNKNTGGPYTVNPTTGVAYCNDTPTVVDPNQLYNPFTATTNTSGKVVRTAIANNNLASVQAINSVAAAYLNLIPGPNNATTSPTGTGNYVSNAGATKDLFNNQFGRLDYNFSSRDHLFGDYRHNHLDQSKNDFFSNGSTGTLLFRENFGLTIDNVFTVNPTTIIDTRVNWTLYNEVHGTPAQQYSAATVGLPASLGAAATESQLPCINFNGATCAANSTSFEGLGDNTSSFDPTTNYQAFTDVVKVIGRHTLKVGFDGRQYRLSVRNFGNAAGTFAFGTNFVGNPVNAFTPAFGGDLASFYFGLPSSGSIDNNARADYHSYYIGSFVQDDWRVSDHLTLNLGLRFDIDTPFREKNNATVNGFSTTAVNSASTAAAAAFKATTVTANGLTSTVSSINTLGGLTYPTSGGAVYNNNSGFFSPRIGFSYSPKPSTVIRGGFGIFVQPPGLSSLNSSGSVSSSALSNQEGFSATTNETVTNNNYLTAATTLSNPFPSGFQQPVGSSQGASTFLGQTISFLAPNEHDIYSERWDFGVQRSLTNSLLLEVLYVGNHSVHLPVGTQNLNAPRVQYLSTTPYRNQALATAYATSVANPYAGLLPNGGTANGATVAYSNLIYPYPQYGSAAVNIENQTIGQSYYHSAIVHVEQRKKHGLTLTANYSFSKLTEADSYLNDEDVYLNHRISPFDHTHHFTAGSTYELPFGKGKMFGFGGNKVMDAVLGGFVVNGIYQFQTGAPVLFSADIPLQPGFTPQNITIQPHLATPLGTTPALNTSVFVTGSSTACPASGACDGSQFINGQYTFHYRTLPTTISSVRIDGFNNLDASLLKNIAVYRTLKLQLRFEAFNVLNHPAFAQPNVSSATASNFGYITSVFANSQPRQVQLGGRIVF